MDTTEGVTTPSSPLRIVNPARIPPESPNSTVWPKPHSTEWEILRGIRVDRGNNVHTDQEICKSLQKVPGQSEGEKEVYVYYHIFRKLSDTCLGGPSGGTFLADTLTLGSTRFRGSAVPCFFTPPPPRLAVVLAAAEHEQLGDLVHAGGEVELGREGDVSFARVVP
mmetsp:Transcript_18830/g.38598  ORF Transcript_18830/g.38598 Transcript_18830/m.38598 type:complete len:166 (+) Transcript_18830:24-521(+)